MVGTPSVPTIEACVHFLSMTDPTTEGLEATPAEIDGMVRNLCAYALGEPDPIQRYEGLTHQQVLFEGMVEAIRQERGRLVADLVVAGLSVTEVAARTSLRTVVKVRKLISFAGQTQRINEATAARKEAQRTAAAEAAREEAQRNSATAEADRHSATAEADRHSAGERSKPDPAGEKADRDPAGEKADRDPAGGKGERDSGTAEVTALPAHLAAPTGKRLLTPADLAALRLSESKVDN
jgi:hypothetical protein